MKACEYCWTEFGSVVEYRQGTRPVRLVLFRTVDHLIPRSYVLDNSPANLIECCQLCNSLKSNKLFSTFCEAWWYVEEKRERKKFRVLQGLRRIPSRKAKTGAILQPSMPLESVGREAPKGWIILDAQDPAVRGEGLLRPQANKIVVQEVDSKSKPTKIVVPKLIHIPGPFTLRSLYGRNWKAFATESVNH